MKRDARLNRAATLSLTLAAFLPTACAMHQPPARVVYKGDHFYARDGEQPKLSSQSKHRLDRVASDENSRASRYAMASAPSGRGSYRADAARDYSPAYDDYEPASGGGWSGDAAPTDTVNVAPLAPISSHAMPALQSHELPPPALPAPVWGNTEPMPLLGSGADRLGMTPMQFTWPVNGKILQAYGNDASGKFNDDIQIASYPGEPVRAAASGTVAYVGDQLEGYGLMLILRHDSGYITSYAQLAEATVRRGDYVESGNVIARAGGTPYSARIQFGIRKDKEPVNPEPLLAQRGSERVQTASVHY